MDFRLYYYPKRIGKHAPGFYGHLKLHKPVTIGWPFLLYGGFSIYDLNRYIANTLKTYDKDEKNYVRNWTIFPKFLKDAPIENGKNNLIWRINTPLPGMLNIIKLYVHKDYKDYEFARKTSIPVGISWFSLY